MSNMVFKQISHVFIQIVLPVVAWEIMESLNL